MKSIYTFLALLLVTLLFVQCKKEEKLKAEEVKIETVKHAKGFSIVNYNSYSIVTVKNTWPKATKS